MSYWSILFILLAIAMAVGPIMIMQPSRRDRRLAALRQTAATLGMHVRMSDYEGKPVAVYSLPVDLLKTTPKWQLIKQLYSHDIHFYQQWQLSAKSDDIPDAIHTQLKQFIDELPDDIIGIEVSSKMLGVWWKERSTSMGAEELKALLERFHHILT